MKGVSLTLLKLTVNVGRIPLPINHGIRILVNSLIREDKVSRRVSVILHNLVSHRNGNVLGRIDSLIQPHNARCTESKHSNGKDAATKLSGAVRATLRVAGTRVVTRGRDGTCDVGKSFLTHVRLAVLNHFQPLSLLS